MFTSCGWFFSEISGIETIQVLRYAARLIELGEDVGAALPREHFLEILATARSNRLGLGTGADIYRALAEPGSVAPAPVVDSELKIS
jgi:hypothetical protein